MIRILLSILAASAFATMAAKPAHAQDRAPFGYEQKSIAVFYGDLDLTNRDGVATLKRRMMFAARTVCGARSMSMYTRPAVETCMRNALLDALNDIGSPAGYLTAEDNKTIASR